MNFFFSTGVPLYCTIICSLALSRLPSGTSSRRVVSPSVKRLLCRSRSLWHQMMVLWFRTVLLHSLYLPNITHVHLFISVYTHNYILHSANILLPIKSALIKLEPEFKLNNYSIIHSSRPASVKVFDCPLWNEFLKVGYALFINYMSVDNFENGLNKFLCPSCHMRLTHYSSSLLRMKRRQTLARKCHFISPSSWKSVQSPE